MRGVVFRLRKNVSLCNNSLSVPILVMDDQSHWCFEAKKR